MQKQKVSIIIPVYNSSEYLKKCIEHIIMQTYSNIEIILINDGSTDNSIEIMEEFAKKDKRIVIINQENKGVSASRNKGIDIAIGQYITFIDSDDEVDENYISTLINNTEKDCLIRCNYGKKQKEGILSKGEYVDNIVSGKFLGVCWGYLFQKDILKEIRFDTNTSYMEDTIFVLQYLFRVNKVKIIKERLYYHIQNSKSLTKNTKNIEMKINGYIYAINKIEQLLQEQNIEQEKNNKFLQKRKIKIIEAEFAKVSNKQQIRNVISKINLKNEIDKKYITLNYKIFYYMLEKKDIKKLYIYIKFRKMIKKLLKG